MAKRNSNLTLVDQNNENEDEKEDVEESESDNTGLKGDRVVIGVSVSSKFGKFVEDAAKAADKTIAALVREALAKFTGYDLSQEPVITRGARTKYATKEEAQAAQRAKVAERNDLIRKLLAEYRAKQEGGSTEESEEDAS